MKLLKCQVSSWALLYPKTAAQFGQPTGTILQPTVTSRRDSNLKAMALNNPRRIVNNVSTTHIDELGERQLQLEEICKLIALLPPKVRFSLNNHQNIGQLVEVILDLGRIPVARFAGKVDEKLSEEPVTEADLEHATLACGEFGEDNRAGINGTLHRISAIRNRVGKVVGLTCRVGRAITGSASMVSDLASTGKSILLLGRPGVGKTTAIRDLCKFLANECSRRVMIVDTSNEIGGDGDEAHRGIGFARRMQVPNPNEQHRIMIEAVENHMPEVIVIDEISTEAEALAARTIAQRGVQLIATAHGNYLENVLKNPSLNDLVGGIASVTLGDDEAKRRGAQKTILEREAPATFDVAVELISRERWRVHLDVSYAVDQILLGKDAGAEVREHDGAGAIFAWTENQSTTSLQSENMATLNDQIPIEKSLKTKDQEKEKENLIETQPFPTMALWAAREGIVNSTTGAVDNGSIPNEQALAVYLYGIDSSTVFQVLRTLKADKKLIVVNVPQQADAILATRMKVKSSGWIREAAKTAGTPLFTVRSASSEHVTKGIRALLGMDPSPGGGLIRKEKTSDAYLKGLESGDHTASSNSPSRRTTIAITESKALMEAQLAIENIVLALDQPAELLPQSKMVLEKQVEIAQQYGLSFQIAGVENSGTHRLRILPAQGNAKSRAQDNDPPLPSTKIFW